MEQLTEQVKSTMLSDAVKAKVYEDVKISDEKAKKYFEDPANKAQFDQPESRDLRHVLVKTKAEAETVRALLEADPSDANWKKVAKKYSEDPGSKDNGGAYAAVTKGQMVARVREGRLEARRQRGLGAREVAVRLARHRGHQGHAGQHADLRRGQGAHQADAALPGAGDGVDEVARARP